MKLLFICLLGLLLVPISQAQTKDQEDYCKYTSATADAAAIDLKAPSFVAGVTQPNTGTPPQTYAGITSSIGNWRKAAFTRDVAKKSCAVYSTTEDLTLKLQYTSEDLQVAALQDRMEEINQALRNLAVEKERVAKWVQAHNATLPDLYTIESAESKLKMDKLNADVAMTAIVIPIHPDTAIKTMLGTKWEAEVANQKATSRLARADNWDLSLEAGVRQSITIPGNGAYAGFEFKWNIGSKKRNRALETADRSFQEWKTNNTMDTVQEARLLQETLSDNLSTNRHQLIQLLAMDDVIITRLQAIEDVDTKEAIAFRTQLMVDKISLQVEIGNCRFRVAQLQQFLEDNF